VKKEAKMTTETQLIRFDWAIKTLLRDKANFDVLEGFLSAILREEVQVLEILDSEANQSEVDKKFNRVDILVKDKKQQKILIEIQNHRETSYLKRILWGVSKLIVDNLPLGEDYRHVNKVISISILYFNFGLEEDYVYYGVNEFKGLHTKKNLTFRRLNSKTRKMEKQYSKDVFPEYYLINVERFKDVIASDLDEWIYLLKHSALRADFHSKNIDRAREKLKLLQMKPEERKPYEDYIKNTVIEKDVIETARNEGRQKGLQEGRQEGENNAKLAFAQKLLAQSMAIESIATLTGLTVEVIKSVSSETD
jgi:predicted transposase/invertase (TIGR01784 family)